MWGEKCRVRHPSWCIGGEKCRVSCPSGTLGPRNVVYGIHPVHLGIIFLANMQIGYMTPPVGMNLFIASYRFKKPITALYSASLPFMVILLVALMLITYWPWLSLGLL